MGGLCSSLPPLRRHPNGWIWIGRAMSYVFSWSGLGFCLDSCFSAVPDSLLFCVYVFPLLCFPCFSAFSASPLVWPFLFFLLFRFFSFPASLLLCFSVFASLFSVFSLFHFLLILLLCFSASLPFCFYLLSFSAVMRVCCFASLCSFASLLPFFTVSLFFFCFALFSPVCILNETLDETQRHPKETLIRNPKWNPTWNPKWTPKWGRKWSPKWSRKETPKKP